MEHKNSVCYLKTSEVIKLLIDRLEEHRSVEDLLSYVRTLNVHCTVPQRIEALISLLLTLKQEVNDKELRESQKSLGLKFEKKEFIIDDNNNKSINLGFEYMTTYIDHHLIEKKIDDLVTTVKNRDIVIHNKLKTVSQLIAVIMILTAITIMQLLGPDGSVLVSKSLFKANLLYYTKE